VAGCCECGDEASGSCATELVSCVGTTQRRQATLAQMISSLFIDTHDRKMFAITALGLSVCVFS
jgi:hypothetical protein